MCINKITIGHDERQKIGYTAISALILCESTNTDFSWQSEGLEVNK